jgi:hypothetical protein
LLSCRAGTQTDGMQLDVQTLSSRTGRAATPEARSLLPIMQTQMGELDTQTPDTQTPEDVFHAAMLALVCTIDRQTHQNRILCMATKYGPKAQLCAPNRTDSILSISLMGHQLIVFVATLAACCCLQRQTDRQFDRYRQHALGSWPTRRQAKTAALLRVGQRVWHDRLPGLQQAYRYARRQGGQLTDRRMHG